MKIESIKNEESDLISLTPKYFVQAYYLHFNDEIFGKTKEERVTYCKKHASRFANEDHRHFNDFCYGGDRIWSLF